MLQEKSFIKYLPGYSFQTKNLDRGNKPKTTKKKPSYPKTPNNQGSSVIISFHVFLYIHINIHKHVIRV